MIEIHVFIKVDECHPVARRGVEHVNGCVFMNRPGQPVGYVEEKCQNCHMREPVEKCNSLAMTARGGKGPTWLALMRGDRQM